MMYVFDKYTYIMHTNTYHIWIDVNPYVYVLFVLELYLNVSVCRFLLYCMYCMYFIQPKLLGVRYIHNIYNTYTNAQDTESITDTYIF
jgi:hypothetical protein